MNDGSAFAPSSSRAVAAGFSPQDGSEIHQVNWDGSLSSTSWPEYGPLAELFNVHKAIRSDLFKFRSEVKLLTLAVSDQKLDELQLRLQFFRRMLLDHCITEDNYIVPAIRTKSILVAAWMEKWEREHEKMNALHSSLVTRLNLLKSQPLILEYQDPTMQASKSQHDAQTQTESSKHQAKRMKISHGNGDANQSTSAVPNLFSRSESDRLRGLDEVKQLTEQFCDSINSHVDDEELALLPVIKDVFTHSEQGKLLVNVLASGVSATVLPWTLRVLSEEERIRFLGQIERYATNEQIAEVTGYIISALPPGEWSAIAEKLPRMEKAASNPVAVNPLIEIMGIHNAIRAELSDLVSLCEFGTEMDEHEVRFIVGRLTFLQSVLEGHSSGEESYIMPQLKEKAPHLLLSTTSHIHDEASSLSGALDDSELPKNARTVYEDHDRECAQIQALIDASHEYLRTPMDKKDERRAKKAALLQEFRAMKDEIFLHMREEEDRMLPLIRKLFPLEAQDVMVRNVFSKVSVDIFPWIIEPMNVSQRVELLRNILRSAPDTVFKEVSQVLARAMRKGALRRFEWDELVLRVPELNLYSQSQIEQEQELNAGPVSEIYRIHKAIRIELISLYEQVTDLVAQEVPHPKKITQVSNRFRFLSRMVEEHSRAEDLIVLPALNARQPGVAERYHEEHCGERYLFDILCEKLDLLQCAGDPDECISLVRSVQMLLRVLRSDMMAHLDEEEKHLWPLLVELFSHDEQLEVVGRIFSQIPEERLREMLPWMIQTLSSEEQESMMSHLLSVTKSTMFEKWLLAWFPVVESIVPGKLRSVKPAVDSESDRGMALQAHGVSTLDPSLRDLTPDAHKGKSDSERAALNTFFSQGKQDIQRAIRAIAQDESLSADMKTRLMQNLMLSTWQNAKVLESMEAGSNDKQVGVVSATGRRAETPQTGEVRYTEEMLQPSYHDASRKVLGCIHYMRDCKLISRCCGKIYTCRLCHDANESHTIDRYETREMMCMHCQTIQPVGQSCQQPDCGKVLGKYFCRVCRLWDNNESRTIYHCHMCNVCRVGKGLGIDNVHCMKCNACIRVQHYPSHKCIERVMESSCPICHEHMFMSSRSVKFLRCGHVMHFDCYELYSKRSMKCPYCKKSLADMSDYFRRLDELLEQQPMPSQYRVASCKLHCNDCNKDSETRFHFLFNKCALCASYDTTILSIDPNGDRSSENRIGKGEKR